MGNPTWPPEVERELVGVDELQQIVRRIAAELTRDYADKNPIVMGVLTGAVVFTADVVRQLAWPLTLDFISVSSYGESSESSGQIKWKKRPNADVAGRHVVIVEDIVDTGRTLAALRNEISAQGAASVAICVLLDKPSRREVDVTTEYVGKQIPDEFVVGYGLDYAQRFRNLPYVGVLRRNAYAGDTQQ